MGFFYFDESIHPRGRFTLGAFAYSEDPLDPFVSEALRANGLIPRVDEFKSRMRMDHSPQHKAAREALHSLIREYCRIALVVAPDHPRDLLGREALRGLDKIVRTNRFRSSRHNVFFDEGIFTETNVAGEAATRLRSLEGCKFHFEQRSHEILGLQVADLIAHTCATMLMAQIGLVTKKVKIDDNSGDSPDRGVELEFELWSRVRWNFFAAAPPYPDTWKSQLDFQVDVESRGLHISDALDEQMRNAAVDRFGKMYLGCIH
jgi:hypothetical protein